LAGARRRLLGTLLAFVLALAWERERGLAELARQASDLYERRQTETERRLEPIRAELKKNRESLETLAAAFGAKEEREAMAASVVVEDSVPFLVNPQLLKEVWSASASPLAELIGNYQLMADLATFYDRIEELRWRIRLRTEQSRPDLDEPIRALVVEMRGEVDDLLEQVGQEIQKPHVRPTGLVHVRSMISAPVETTASIETKVMLVNHLKSKGFGSQSSSNAKRRRQARRVAQIYRRLIAEGQTNVIVLGDLNDTPDSAPLAPLLAQTDLRDITTHPSFTNDGRPGTFGNGTKSNKIDYVLLSPALFARVTRGAIFRKGVWGGKQGTLFPHYPTITRPVEAASDHAAIYADIKWPPAPEDQALQQKLKEE
jgi:Endonuclease/Exonuclease/phosphatase family